MNNRPVCGEDEVRAGAVQGLSGAGVEVDDEGENGAEGERLQTFSGGRVDHWTGAEAKVGHGHHLGEDTEVSGCCCQGQKTKKWPSNTTAPLHRYQLVSELEISVWTISPYREWAKTEYRTSVEINNTWMESVWTHLASEEPQLSDTQQSEGWDLNSFFFFYK